MTLAKINAQIAASQDRLRDLYRQQRALLEKDRAARTAASDARRNERKARNREVLRLFDDEGLGAIQISRRMALPYDRVRQFLSSRGRTKRGREALRSQLAIMAETQR